MTKLTKWMLLLSAALLSICIKTFGAIAADSHTIELKLFGKNVIEEYDGCAFSLWQEDKDPQKDKFSYVFFSPLHDANLLPAWVKIGDDVREYERQDVAEGGPDYVAWHQIYRASEENWLILEIKNQFRDGDDIIIDKAELTFVSPDKFPFISVVRGKLGCPQSTSDEVEEAAAQPKAPSHFNYTALPGDPISVNLEEEFDSISLIPAPIRNYVAQNYASCDIDGGPGYAARFSISPEMSLWQVPCALYASNATSNYFVALNANDEHFTPLFATHPQQLKGFEDGDLKELLNAFVEPQHGHIVASDMSNSGCGSFWRYALRAVEGEAIEAFLVEYRDKQECDGDWIDPINLPLIYQAN